MGASQTTPIPEDPCIFVMNGIIVFCYVDDIIIVNHPNHTRQAAELDNQMKNTMIPFMTKMHGSSGIGVV
jgi:hypothetical protein